MTQMLQGGKPFYGIAIGVLMMDAVVPRPPGDIGNANTFDFPVRYKVVRGATTDRVIHKTDASLLESFVDAARELEEEGVRAITTSCGYLAYFQSELAAAVSIPVFTSSLMQVPLVHRMLRPDQKIGIMTADARTLTPKHLAAVGIEHIPTVIYGAEHTPAFYDVFATNGDTLDWSAAEAGIVGLAERMVAEHPDVGAIVCEGSNFSLFGPAVQRATGLPFFDIVTMTRYIYHAVVKQAPAGGFM